MREFVLGFRTLRDTVGAQTVGACLENQRFAPNGNAEQRTTKTGRTRVPARPKKRPTYTVKSGDTLGRIAEQTGVEVELLQELNPAVDPQALVAGQKIQLRE